MTFCFPISFQYSLTYTIQETFDLPVWHKVKEIMLLAEIHPRGYIHRITVYIENFPLMFELDEKKLSTSIN